MDHPVLAPHKHADHLVYLLMMYMDHLIQFDLDYLQLVP